MRGRILSALCAATCVALFGCGGSSGGGGGNGGTGAVRGTLATNAAGGTVRLEGTSYSATVGGNGSFILPGVPPGEYTLSISAPGGQGGAVSVRVTGGQTTDVSGVPLAAVGQIAGLVTDSVSGAPIAGARVVATLTPLVWAYGSATPPAVLNGVQAAGGTPVNATTSPGRQSTTTTTTTNPPQIATTDSSGSYTIEGAEPGPYSLVVSAGGYQTGYSGTFVSADGTASGDVQLVAINPNNATLSGTVTTLSGGQTVPLAQVRVDVWANGVAVPLANSGSVGGTVSSPPAALNGSAAGSSGGSAGSSGANAAAANENIDPLTLPPFQGAQTAITDSNGNFTITNLPPGSYTVNFSCFGYQFISDTITLTTAQQAVQNADMTYILATVSGIVSQQNTNGSVTPLAGAWVNAYGNVYEPVLISNGGTTTSTVGAAPAASSASSGPNIPGGGVAPVPTPIAPPGVAVTAADGSYSLQVEAGQITVSAWANNDQPNSVTVTVTPAGATGVNLTLTPWPAGSGPAPILGGFGTGATAGRDHKSVVVRASRP
jgi:hypothetical protein